MQLFGKDLFTFKKAPDIMYDFAQHGILNAREAFDLWEYARTEDSEGLADGIKNNKKVEEAEKKAKDKPKPSPKELYKMEALNDHDFTITIDKEYINSQIIILQEKLELLGKKPKKKKESGQGIISIGSDSELGHPSKKFSRQELESMIERLHNRRSIASFKDVLDKYPHTTSQLVNKVITENRHLKAKEYSEFIPELPKDAVKAIKEYNEMCVKLCNKKTNFYIIAKKEDFARTPSRRDPILLAQSPFGFFWNILGAWEEEMIFLGDL